MSEELGGEAGLRALCEAAREAGLGVVLDVVPNHMAATDENPLWADEDKRARYFDWDPETGWYRRFFDIGELGGVRVEDEEVFGCTHRRSLELVRDGLVDGLRVDHIDGLVDPRGYLERLREHGVPSVWVEKILEPGEHLRAWPVEGTTGYEFANDVARPLPGARRRGAAHAPLHGAERARSGRTTRSRSRRSSRRRRRPSRPSASGCASELGEPFPELERALASFEAYRTYVEPWSGRVEDADREAVADAEVPERLARILLLEDRGVDTFVTRFQQTTGPVVAKGVEDTALYRYNRFVALNQVGGSPGAWTLPLDEFHRRNAERAERLPRALLTTHTHDAKRSSDVTARLVALSWHVDEWIEAVARWRRLIAHLKPLGAPDGNEEYLILQTLVGAWPISQERLLGFVEKALREAKTNTSWVAQNELWEAAVKVFCFGLYGHEPFRQDFEPFVELVAEAGRGIALGQLLLKLTCPGVPDLYQGDELELLQLVDPDNRGPVDWERRRALLDEVLAGAPLREETAQLHVLTRVLRLRAALPEAFAGAVRAARSGRGRLRLRTWRRGARGRADPSRRGQGRGAGRVARSPPGATPGFARSERRVPYGRMTEGGWDQGAWGENGQREPLPKVDDLPIADQGYDREAVREAFDAFYRHTAQLDSTLRVLESVEVFGRQARELRADIRSLRAASWGPAPSARHVWSVGHEVWSPQEPPAAFAASLPRLAVWAALIVAVGVGAALAELSTVLIVLLVVAAWALVALIEVVIAGRRAAATPAPRSRARACPGRGDRTGARGGCCRCAGHDDRVGRRARAGGTRRAGSHRQRRSGSRGTGRHRRRRRRGAGGGAAPALLAPPRRRRRRGRGRGRRGRCRLAGRLGSQRPVGSRRRGGRGHRRRHAVGLDQPVVTAPPPPRGLLRRGRR